MSDPAAVIFAVLFPVLLAIEIVLAALLWRAGGGRLPRPVQRREMTAEGGQASNAVWLFSIWLFASGLGLALGFVAAFVAVHVLLFTFGTAIAMAGMIVSGIFLAGIPVVLGLMIRRQAHRR
jgi:uncharacterized membrane protein YphA (DoxX/SURF4 family)